MAPLFLFSLVKWIILTGLILGSVLIIIKYYFSQQKKNDPPATVNRSEEQKILVPLRLQACERIILFLERISPGNLVMRLNQPDFTALQLQSAMIKTIREEYEYNLSQQLYISAKAWELVKNAKEESIKLINVASGNIQGHGPASELIKNIFELTLESSKPPVDTAIEEVKKEIQRLF